MTKTLSIITAVHQSGVTHLRSTYESLAQQQLPDGWDWEWLIQEDGDDVGAAAEVPTDPRIQVAKSRHGGPHVARTVALGRSSGEYVKNLDADDVLAEGVLTRDIEVLEQNKDIGWTTSAVLDLMPDGSLVGFPGDPAAGRISQGAVFAHWEKDKRAQVHPTTLCIRRSLVLALGGWMALPASGDTGLLLGLDALAPGWFHEQVGLHYRKHPGQITADTRHSQGAEWEARMHVIGEHARALHKLVAGAGPGGGAGNRGVANDQ